MLTDYSDITEKLGEPIWWDRHGVPRYEPFEPHYAGIYIDQAVLYQISCQSCGRVFLVCSANDAYRLYGPDFRLQPRGLHYGDPPNHGCVGDTMNCDDWIIIEWWEHADYTVHLEGGRSRKEHGWVRVHEVDGYRLTEAEHYIGANP